MKTFDDFDLMCIILKNHSDEEVRKMFRKLQRGKPLNWREELNAYPGSIVPLMRNLSKHDFLIKLIFP